MALLDNNTTTATATATKEEEEEDGDLAAAETHSPPNNISHPEKDAFVVKDGDDMLANATANLEEEPSNESIVNEHKNNNNNNNSHNQRATTIFDEEDGHDNEPQPTCRFLCCRQVRAVATKNLLSKYRTPVATCMEIFSPLLIMLVLVAAYQLSTITDRKAATYDTVQIDVGSLTELTEWANVLQNNQNDSSSSSLFMEEEERRLEARRILRRLLPELEEEEEETHWLGNTMAEWFNNAGGMSEPSWQRIWNQHPVMPWHRRQQQQQRSLQLVAGDDELETDDDEVILSGDDDDDVYALLDQAYRQVRRLLKNPMIVPTFSQYVTLSQLLGSLVNVQDLPRVFSDSSYGRQWGNLLTLGTLHLSPRSSPVVDSFLDYLNDTYPLLVERNNLTIRLHDSEEQGIEYIDETHDTERTWALIDLSRFPEQLDWSNNGSHRQDVEFSIRLNYTTIPNTNEITDFVSIGLNTQYQQYYLSGYLTLQRTLNEFARDYYGRSSNNTTTTSAGNGTCDTSGFDEIWSMPMPTAAYSQNSFFLAVGYLLGLTIVMAYLYPTSRLIKSLVEEKETKLKETMFIMGLKPFAHWTAWMTTSLATFGLISILVSYTLSNNVLTYSNPAYLFWWIFFFSTATVGFCFALAALFSKAKLASIIGPMALFATLLPRFIFFGYNRYEASTAKKWASLLPATAFSFGADIVADYEYGEIGVQEWNSAEGDYSFNTSVGFLVFDTFLYIFLGWYLDLVIPREYGSARPFWFIISPSFWCSCWFRRKNRASLKSSEAANDLPTVPFDASELAQGPASTAISSSQDHEPVSSSLAPRVIAHDLVKVYSKKKDDTPAVNHLDLTLYESHITSLLGHNGAGKSTTISMLTGLFRPTSGDATIFGHSITEDVSEARRSIGICPQQNVLFDSLTVMEHIYFYQRLKGIRPSRDDARNKAEEIGLEDFFHVTSAALSGGNKRKLCVASALCGNPKFLVLDEPTSGMDPNARRKTWDVLRQRRFGRSILLCTHFMDEAEILSDRIAIMKEGALRCSGSPSFLKDKFSVGYNFTVVLETPETERDEEDPEGPGQSGRSIEQGADRLLTFARIYVPNAQIQRIGGKEVTIRLPTGEESTFPELFDQLQSQRESFSVGAFGIENASLEEVFIDLADDYDDDVTSSASELQDESDSMASRVSAPSSFVAQVGLLYWKRCVVQRRDVKGLVFAVVVPVLLIALVLLILTINVPIVGPSIEMSPSLYELSNVGTDALTDVVVGGGISAREGEDVDAEYSSLLNFSLTDYSHLNFDRRRNLTSSKNVSSMLLSSINTRDHNERYGAYALFDSVNIEITVDWEQTIDGVSDLLNLLNENGELQNISFNLDSTPREALEYFELLNSSWTGSAQEDAMVSALQSIFGTDVSRPDFEAEVGGILNETLETPDPNLIVDRFVNLLLGTNESDSNGSPIDQWNLSELGARLNSTTFNFNQTIIANEAGNILSSDEAVSTIVSSGVEALFGLADDDSDILAIMMVWVIVEADNALQEGDELSFQDFLSNLSVDLDQNISFQGRIGSLTINPESRDLILSEVSIRVGEQSALEWDRLNSTLPSGEQTYFFQAEAESSVLHNSSSPHAVAAFNQHYMDFVFKSCFGRSVRVVSQNNPLPLTTQQTLEIKTILSILASLFILIPYCFIPGAFIVFLVQEKATKAKHLQLVSGANITAYWLGAYLYDISRYFLLTILVMAVFVLYGKEAAEVFVGTWDAVACTALLTFGYGLSILPFSYLVARRFENHSSCQIAVIGLVFITGFGAVNAYFILDSIEKTKNIARALLPIFRMWPAFNVGIGFIEMAQAFWEKNVLFYDTAPLHYDVAGKPLVLLYGLVLPYFALLLLVEFAQEGGAGAFGRMLRRINDWCTTVALKWSGVQFMENGQILLDDGLRNNAAERDSDVLEEEAHVQAHAETLKQNAPVFFHDIWKVYLPSIGLFGAFMSSTTRLLRWLVCCGRKGNSEVEERRAVQPKRAVRGISAAVYPDEIFALLGANGAGKTTSLGMLTGDVTPTSGGIYVASHDATGRTELDGMTKARQHLGFCPQVDPLVDRMSVQETLALYGRLRGIPSDKINGVVQRLMGVLLLGNHGSKTCDSLSGGMKRKLSLGIALIGDPSVLLIDESSSGLDPLAKRRMWDLIASVSKNKTVMLTTHSMEEAESLCTRAGIMAKGQLLCLGSVQHLKTKYLDGYTIDVFCEADSTDTRVEAVVNEIVSTALPGSTLSERHGRWCRFDFHNASTVGLGTAFRNLESLKQTPESALESYSISQCSLEQVFIQLSNQAAAALESETDDDTDTVSAPMNEDGTIPHDGPQEEQAV